MPASLDRLEKLREEWIATRNANRSEEYLRRGNLGPPFTNKSVYKRNKCSICGSPYRLTDLIEQMGLCVDCLEAMEHFRTIFHGPRLRRSATLYLRVHPDNLG